MSKVMVLTMLLVGVGFGWSWQQETSGGLGEGAALAASFESLLAAQKPGDLQAVPRVLRYLDQELAGAEPRVVDRCLVAFDRFLDRVVADENASFQDIPFPQQEALYELQGGGCGAAKAATAEQKRLRDRLSTRGLSLAVDTGSYEVQKDETFLLKVFSNRVSEPLKVFLRQREREYREGFWRDGALTISPRAVAERLLFWEAFLRENPAFVMGTGDLEEKVEGLTRVLLRGVDNTPPFDPESHRLNENFQEAYRFLAGQPQSPLGALVGRYRKILEGNGFHQSKASEAFLDEVLPEG